MQQLTAQQHPKREFGMPADAAKVATGGTQERRPAMAIVAAGAVGNFIKLAWNMSHDVKAAEA